MDQDHSHVHPEAAGYERQAGGYRHDRHNPWAPSRYVIRRVIDPAHRTRKRKNREPGEKGRIRSGGKVAPRRSRSQSNGQRFKIYFIGGGLCAPSTRSCISLVFENGTTASGNEISFPRSAFSRYCMSTNTATNRTSGAQHTNIRTDRRLTGVDAPP